ncbi:MAG TPA: hypothetical protein VIL69_16555 [Roseomonas sp.]
MIELDLPTDQASLDEVIRHLAATARSSGLDTAGGFLEALRKALAAESAGAGGR